MAPLRLVFAGGGTGGHLYPALAIADAVRGLRPEADVTFIGTNRRIEARVVPARGYRFEAIWISGFRRALTPATVLFPLKVAVALVQSLRVLRRRRPQVVIGTGGYVCGPPLFAARLLGIATLIQEQNSYPGVTTRLLASGASEVHISFEETRRHLRRPDNVRLSGNPTRALIGTVGREEAAAVLGVDPARTTVLVLGGSLGAASLNRAMARLAPLLAEEGVQVVWQAGEAACAAIVASLPRGSAEGMVRVYPFIERMECAYAVADLAVARAGATTLAELTRAGVPAVLVPYPRAAGNHQTANAGTLVAAGAAVLCRDEAVDEALPAVVRGLLSDAPRLRSMAERARSMAHPGAATALAHAVLRLAEQ